LVYKWLVQYNKDFLTKLDCHSRSKCWITEN